MASPGLLQQQHLPRGAEAETEPGASDRVMVTPKKHLAGAGRSELPSLPKQPFPTQGLPTCLRLGQQQAALCPRLDGAEASTLWTSPGVGAPGASGGTRGSAQLRGRSEPSRAEPEPQPGAARGSARRPAAALGAPRGAAHGQRGDTRRLHSPLRACRTLGLSMLPAAAPLSARPWPQPSPAAAPQGLPAGRRHEPGAGSRARCSCSRAPPPARRSRAPGPGRKEALPPARRGEGACEAQPPAPGQAAAAREGCAGRRVHARAGPDVHLVLKLQLSVCPT